MIGIDLCFNLSLFKLIVGLLDLLEALFGQRFKLLTQMHDLVRMILAGKAPVGMLDVFRRGITINFQNGIRVPGAAKVAGIVVETGFLVAMGSAPVEIMGVALALLVFLKGLAFFLLGVQVTPQQSQYDNIIQPAPAYNQIR